MKKNISYKKISYLSTNIFTNFLIIFFSIYTCITIHMVAQSGPTRIMPLGNSITRGTGSSDLCGYRRSLYLQLINDGYNIDFIGSYSDGIYFDFDRDHAGTGGIRDDQLAHLLATGYNQKTTIQETPGPYLETYPADLILLHIGTNGLDPDPSDVNDILNQIDIADTSTWIILARIINHQNFDCNNYPDTSEITIFNDNIEQLAQTRITNGDKIIVVDMECGATIDYLNDMDDKLHPNDAGYVKMADLWFNKIKSLLTTPSPQLPIIVSIPNSKAFINELYFYDVEATGSPAPKYDLIIAPEEMWIDTVTGEIEWTPDSIGIFDIQIEAKHSLGSSIQQFNLNINSKLNINDLAIVGYNSDYPSEFAFVVLKENGIVKNSIVKFTDRGVFAGDDSIDPPKEPGSFREGNSDQEGILIYTAPVDLPYGSVIIWNEIEDNPDFTWIENFNVSVLGDQIIIYQDNINSEFIFALNNEVLGNSYSWQSDLHVDDPNTGLFRSNIPKGLVDSTSAIAFDIEIDNRVYNDGIKPTSEEFLNSLLNENSWKGDNDERQTITSHLTDIRTDPNQTITHTILKQNYPNPFNPDTRIEFFIPETKHVNLKVYDVLGKEIVTLVNKMMHQGVWNVTFEAKQLSSGVYFYLLQTDNYIDAKKMILL